MQMKTNKNGVKLLAAAMIFAIAFAGISIIIEDNDVDAANLTEIGVTEGLTGNVTVDLASTKTIAGTLNFTKDNGVSSVIYTINYAATGNGATMITGGTLHVGPGVKLILNMTSSAAASGCHILVDTNLVVDAGAEVVFKQSANAQGQSWWSSDSTAETLTLNGTLTIDGANGFSGIAATLGTTAKIDVKSTTSSAAALNFASYSDAEGAKITVSDGNVFPYFSTAVTDSLKGEIDAKNSKVVFAAGSSTVTGKITASTVQCSGTASVTGAAGKIAAEYVASTIGNAATLLTSANITEVTVTGTQNLTGNVYVPANKTLILDGATVQNTGNNAYIIIVDGELQSNAAYIYAGVYISNTGTFTGINTHSNTMTGTMVDDYKVGFGDKLVLTGTIPAGVTLDAYGAVTLNDATVAGTVKTYVGSTMDIQGTVTVSSAFTINAGAEIELSGTITVKNDANGGASLTLADNLPIEDYSGTLDLNLISKLTIVDGGVLKINKPTSNAATSSNSLVVGTNAQLIVEGTLDITGTLSGTVQDKGTVLFNGTAAAAGATIVLYDGISITVGSATGALTITDAGIVTDIDPNAATANIADGNQVVLTNVKNVTISENVTSKVNKTNTTKYYICNMSVSGSVTKVNGITEGATLAITASADTVSIDGTSTNTGMNIIDTLTIGKNVAVTIANKVTLKGTMSSMEDTTPGTIAVTGKLTVSGQLFGKVDTISYTGTINAVYYTITTVSEGTSTTVYYYTGFAQAANTIGDADEDTITVLGSVSMSADAEIAPQMTIAVPGTLTIKDGYTLTITDGALLSVTNTVKVKGTLVIVNSDTGLTIGKLAYDTSKANGKTVTYTNLANALAGAVEGDIITLAQAIDLSGSVTIPEGVTVQTGKYTVTMNDGATLKVNGTFAVQNGGSVIAYDDEDASTDPLQWGKDIKISVDGVMTSTTSYAYATYKISGAYFTLKGVNYITNLAYAAEKVDDGTVSVNGNVAAGDVTFTEKENGNLVLNITTGSTLSASTITLDGAKLIIAETATVTGNVSAATGDSTSTVNLNKAGYINVESTTMTVGTDNVDCMYINGTVKGVVTVSEGYVIANDASGNANTDLTVSGTDNKLVIADDAVLDILGQAAFATTDAKASAIDVKGTLNIIGTVTVTGIMTVSGDVVIARNVNTDAATLNIDGKIVITGTVTVSEDETKYGTFSVGSTDRAAGDPTTGYVTLGEKPAQIGATGAIVGKVTLVGNSFMKVYDGASVSDAKINWDEPTQESKAVNTVFYINGTPYVTAYAAPTNTVLLVGTNSVIASDWVNANVGLGITGVVTTNANTLSYWFSDEALTAPIESNKIGGTEAIYFDAPISEADFKISVGSGMSLWIDGVKYLSGQTIGLTVGDHKVQVIVNPGYKGTTSVTVNGQTVTDKITVTVAMVGQDNVVTVIGDISIDVGETPAPVEPTEKDDGMGITDYLLIVLVVLAAILVVIVAIRMMRS